MIFMAEKNAAWTFRKERHPTPPDGLRLFLCGDEGEFASYDECALVLGKLYALFGEPAIKANFDSIYVYEIVAEASGRTANLTIEEYNNATAIYYSEDTKDAANALAAAISAAQPADYEYSYKEMESFHLITYFVKDGNAGSRDRAMTIKEIFDGDPSPEDIEQFTEWGYKLE